MKKAKVCIALILCIVFLAGCVNKGNNQDLSGEQTPNNTPTTEENGLPPISKCVAGNEKGYYYTDVIYPYSANLIYIDFETKQEIALCSKPECSHNNESCTSYIQLDEKMAVPFPLVIGDSILYIDGTLHDAPLEVMLADLDGSNRRKLCEIPSNLLVMQNQIFTDGISLFFKARETVYNDNGEPIDRLKIMKLDLSDGTISVIKEFEVNQEAENIESAFDRKLILSSWLMDSDPTNDTVYTKYYVLDVDTKEEKEITIINSDLSGSTVFGNYLYEQDYQEKNIIRTNLRDGKIITFEYGNFFNSIDLGENTIDIMSPEFDNIFHFGVLDIREGETIRHQYIVNLDTNKVTEFTLYKVYNDDVITILQVLEDKLLVLLDWEMEKIIDSNGDENYRYTPQYALISKENYIASIPEYEHITSFRSEICI